MRLIPKRRLASTTVGVILAIALIFSMFTVSNNAVKSQIYDEIKNMPYHFYLYGDLPADNYTRVMSEIRNLSHVDWVRGYIYAPMYFNSNESIITGYWDNMSSTVSIVSGRLPFYSDEIAVSYWYAKTYNVSIGEKFNVSALYTNHPENLSYEVVGIYYPHSSLYRCDAVTSEAGLSRFEERPEAFIAVKIDDSYLLSSLDVNQINMKIWSVKSAAQTIFSENGGASYEMGSSSYVTYSNPLGSVIYLVYSLPIIVMGVYLSRIGIEIEINERRREFGIIKVRGGSSRNVMRIFMGELIIYSIIGGVVGYVLGETMAYLGNEFIYHLPYFSLDAGATYAVAGVLLAAFMFLTAFYSPWKKIKNTSIIDLISHFSQKFSRMSYTPTRDLAFSIAMWGYLILGVLLIENTNFSGGMNLLVVIVEVIAMSFMIALPFILIFLPLFMTRLLTLGTQKLYKWLVKPIVRVMRVSGDIVSYGVERNPKNMAYVAFILAFVLTFSSLVASTQDTQSEIAQVQSIQIVGGDFIVSSQQFVGSVQLLESICNSENQSAHVWIATSGGTVMGDSVSLYLGNYKNYTESVYDLGKFMESGAFKSNRVVISRSLAVKFGLKVGDTISIALNSNSFVSPGISTNEGIHTYQISGIFYSLPGLSYGEDAVFVDSHVLPQNSTYVIIKARNYNALEAQLKMAGLNYQARRDSENQGNQLFFKTTEIFLVILGGAAIAIVNYSLYYNRRTEIALYRVRGARKSQIRRMLLTEGGAIILLALIVGVAVGLSLSYFITAFQLASTDLPGSFVVGRNFAEVTFMLVLVFFVTQYVLAYIFARTEPAEVIRANGGEM